MKREKYRELDTIEDLIVEKRSYESNLRLVETARKTGLARLNKEELYRQMPLAVILNTLEAGNRYQIKADTPSGKIDISSANPEQLIAAYYNIYKEAVQRIKQYEEIKKEAYKIIERIENERRLNGEELLSAQERTAIFMDSCCTFALAIASRYYGEKLGPVLMGGYYIPKKHKREGKREL